MQVLFTTGEALFLAENGKTTELPSYRALRYKETIQQISDNKAWKTTGQGAQFMGTDRPQESADNVRLHFGGLALYGEEFLYTLTLDASGGLYRRDFSLTAVQEGHICSGNDSRLGEIASHGDDVAACVLYPDGSSHIGLFHLPQSICSEITDGDSVESSPSWSANGASVYFSTCGIARGQNGMRFSPRSIAVFHVNAGRMEILAEDEKFDYLAPREDADGSLWFIRQPYDPDEKSTGNVLLDVLLFPFRLVKAIFGFLNVFSIMFGGESLRSGKQPGDIRSKQKSEKDLFFEGNIIRAEQNLKENQRSGDEYAGILPRSRVLVRRKPDGTEEIVAKGVLDYCLCKEGVVYSNGSHILRQTPDGKTEHLAKARLAVRLNVIE